MERGRWLQSLFISPVHWLSKAGAIASVAGLLFLAFAVTFEVVMRYVFNSPTKWVNESVEFALLFIVVAGVAYTQKEKGHIRVDLLVARFSKPTQKKAEIFSSLLGIFYCGVLSWAGFISTSNFYRLKSVSMMLDVPLYLAMVWVGIGAALLALEFMITLVSSITKGE